MGELFAPFEFLHAAVPAGVHDPGRLQSLHVLADQHRLQGLYRPLLRRGHAHRRPADRPAVQGEALKPGNRGTVF